jgi:putative transposase
MPLKKCGFVPDKMVTDDAKSYGAAARDLGLTYRHERVRWRNNLAENSHQPTAAKGAKDVRLQERRASATIPLHSRSHVQRF